MLMRRLRRRFARYLFLARKLVGKLQFDPGPAPQGAQGPYYEGHRSLNGVRVVITGASGGIGSVIAADFAARGAHLVLNGRDEQALDALRAGLDHPDRTAVYACDISSAGGCDELISFANRHLGGIDVLINNAADPGPAKRAIWDTELKDFDRVMQTNLTAAFCCARQAISLAHEHSTPIRVINVSSGIVGLGAPGLGAYGVSKMALEGLTQAIAMDSADDDLVSVVSVRPRSVRTQMTRGYYDKLTYELMDDPDAVRPAIRFAATASRAEIHGKSISDLEFVADPLGAVVLRDYRAAAPIELSPVTYKQPEALELPGAYMHFLENPASPFESVAAAIAERSGSHNLYAYPDPANLRLRQAIANHHGLSPENIVVDAGSSTIIDKILRLFAGPGSHIVITKPTWSFFIAFMMRHQIVPTVVPMSGRMVDGSLRHDLDAMLAAIKPTTRLLYLCNPCNPTGSTVDPDDLRQFLKKAPAHVTILLDEAYIQYAREGRDPLTAQCFDDVAARVIGLRTFSKFFGLSGARVGYAYGRPEVVRLIEHANNPFCISSLSIVAANAALGDTVAQEETYRMNASERKRLSAALRELDISYQPSDTSFILFESPCSQEKLRQDLLSRGLVLPIVEQFQLNYGVLPIGIPEHNDILIDYLRAT